MRGVNQHNYRIFRIYSDDMQSCESVGLDGFAQYDCKVNVMIMGFT